MKRQIKSYQDIADYILGEIRLSQTGELPREVGLALGEYGGIQQIQPMFGNGIHAFFIELSWNPSSRTLIIRFLWHGGEMLQEFRFQVAKNEVPQ